MLSSHDELHQLKSLGEKYPGYHEEPITFMPTYKCDFAQNNVYLNKKNQCPSYTDRILIKQNDPQSEIKYNRYDANTEVLGSDHRPVYLDLSIRIGFDQLMDP